MISSALRSLNKKHLHLKPVAPASQDKFCLDAMLFISRLSTMIILFTELERSFEKRTKKLVDAKQDQYISYLTRCTKHYFIYKHGFR